MDIYLITIGSAVSDLQVKYFVFGNGREECMKLGYGAYAREIEPEAYVMDVELVGETVNGAANWALETYRVAGG